MRELYRILFRYSSTHFRRRRCRKPEDCAADLILDYVWKRGLRGKGRCEIQNDTILIKIPGARNQLKVLCGLLLFEIRSTSNHCRDCNFNGTCSIAEEFDDNDNTPRTQSQILVDPVTPEDILRDTELVGKFLKSIKNPRHRQALKDTLEGSSRKEIAAHFHVKPNTVRQWLARDLQRLQRRLANLIGRADAKAKEVAAPRSKQSHPLVEHRSRALVSGLAGTSEPLRNASNTRPLKVKTLKGVR